MKTLVTILQAAALVFGLVVGFALMVWMAVY